MTKPKNPKQIFLSDEEKAKMVEIKDRDGVPYAQQIKRGLQLYFDQCDRPWVSEEQDED